MTPTLTPTSTPIPTLTPTPIPTPTPTPIASTAKIVVPATANLGSVAIGLANSKSFNIKNSGKSNLIGTVTVIIDPPSRSSVFTISPSAFNLAPGQSQPETVTFAPDVPSDAAAALIASNDALRPTTGVALSGTGLAGKLTVPKTFTIAGSVGLPIQASLTIKNAGKGFLSGSWAPIAIAPYSVAAGSFGPLQPGATTNITITFSPTLKGNAPTVVLPITVGGPSTGTTAVTLKGVGK
jgi:hypothetical protein